jgi:glycine/sarcosine N-methyltransferase
MYDDFSIDYDRFVNWPERLSAELPFIERQLEAVQARRVLDAACGTGQHAIALAGRGYELAGADLSAGMIERAQSNATAAGVKVRWQAAGFGELRSELGNDFDAVLCLGNSLPHVLTVDDLSVTLSDFAACLRPGGLLLIQNRNFDRVLAGQERWMQSQAHREGQQEWLFLRFYDFQPQGTLLFTVVTLYRDGTDEWAQREVSTHLWPQQQHEVTAALDAAGYDNITCYGDMSGAPFDAKESPNLVVRAQRT